MLFLLFVMTGTAIIACSAIAFSVWGLVQTFSTTALIWGTAIEIAKLVLASVVYRYWDKFDNLSKFFGVIFIGLLMVITSLGISGHIISSLQESSFQSATNDIKIESVVSKVERLREQLSYVDERIKQDKERLSAIDAEVASLPNTYVTARTKLIRERQPEKDEINSNLEQLFAKREELFNELIRLEEELRELQLAGEEIQVKTGPIAAVVETFGVDGSKSIYLLILIIVLSFDPVAVYLTIAVNRISMDLKKSQRDHDDGTRASPEALYDGPHGPIEMYNDGEKPSNREDEEILKNILSSIQSIKKKMDTDDERERRIKSALI